MSVEFLAQMLPGPLEILVTVLVFTFAWILPVIAFWKICAKAGFSAALGLLMIIPIANIILPLYIAFADWPALRREDQSS
jgi:hypothetical protein